MSGNHSEIFLKSARDGGAIFYFSSEEMALRDQGGNIVPLRRQSAHLLSVLADQPGKIVSKDELIDKVWGKIAVTDDSLNQCISDVRKAIGDTDKTVLQTHPRKGYSLVVQDKETGEDHANTRMGLRKALFAALIALIAILGARF
jgi:DNA-binding winged helix-turn-helix (wHTH) protein